MEDEEIDEILKELKIDFNDHIKTQYKNSNLLRKYGINLKEYSLILREQNYCCKICGINQSRLDKDLYIDHCHITGKVRGLLCHGCNSGLGFFKDNIKSLEQAINYLKS